LAILYNVQSVVVVPSLVVDNATACVAPPICTASVSMKASTMAGSDDEDPDPLQPPSIKAAADAAARLATCILRLEKGFNMYVI
jgi:hypothetical protein